MFFAGDNSFARTVHTVLPPLSKRTTKGRNYKCQTNSYGSLFLSVCLSQSCYWISFKPESSKLGLHLYGQSIILCFDSGDVKRTALWHKVDTKKKKKNTRNGATIL